MPNKKFNLFLNIKIKPSKRKIEVVSDKWLFIRSFLLVSISQNISIANYILESDDIKSAFGIGLDFFTPVGPLNFTLSQYLSKGSNDITESFRFNLGTSFWCIKYIV